jgi:hypothetical protein
MWNLGGPVLATRGRSGLGAKLPYLGEVPFDCRCPKAEADGVPDNWANLGGKAPYHRCVN